MWALFDNPCPTVYGVVAADTECFVIENPCFVPTDAPVSVIVPSVIPASEACNLHHQH